MTQTLDRTKSFSMAFIVFEGLDGAGKSTLTRLLKEHLVSVGITPILTREPGGTPLGEELRQVLLRTGGPSPLPRTELFLYEAIRAQHVEEVIRPAIRRGDWVICDRFTASSVAFQAAGRSLSAGDIKWLNDFATQGIKPDLTVLLDLSVEESHRRIDERISNAKTEKDRFEQESFSFHEKVRRSYLEQAKNPQEKWLVLDARQAAEISFTAIKNSLKENQWLGS